MNESEEFSDEGLDEFEESVDDTAAKKKGTTFSNKPFDEAYEVSQDLSMAESYDGRNEKHERERKLQNDIYDEAIDVSQSMDQSNAFSPKSAHRGPSFANAGKPAPARVESKENKESKGGNTIANQVFDEALDISQGSDDSVDTVTKRNKKVAQNQAANKSVGGAAKPTELPASSRPNAVQGKDMMPTLQQSQPSKPPKRSPGGESASEDGDHEESYENIEGAYNAKDFQHLSVSAEVKDLFQYIERYKPQEIELLTTLKCFIPEYIPTVGEMDAFIKVPRPDGKPDDLGLKFLDEPAASQSDPTVLELQLRAMSKKVQYGDVAVRSIEDATKNTAAIDRWIQSISDLHRTKPPPQVHYRRNMPDLDRLMEVWPEEFEKALEGLSLPGPDLDLSLVEYAKLLCSIVDIPTYDNPIESLHLLFNLFIEFKSNPHFQARGDIPADGAVFGDANVLEINQGFK